jgi:DNA-binding XRE family transcriptional regulator
VQEVSYRNLRAEKARHALTTQDLADVLGISRQAMTHRIMGQTELSLTEAKKLVDFFNSKGSDDISIDELFFS